MRAKPSTKKEEEEKEEEEGGVLTNLSPFLKRVDEKKFKIQNVIDFPPEKKKALHNLA